MTPLLALFSGTSPAAPVQTAPGAPDSVCPSVPELPYGWRLDWGLAPGRNEADAISSAQEAARGRLLAAACREASDLRCAAAERNIVPWGTPRYDRKKQSACAAMVIKLDALQSFEKDLARLDADMAALGKAAADAGAATAPVALGAPSWSSGCVAGPLGHALAAQLRNELAKHGVRLVSPEVRDASASVLTLTIAPGGERATVSASLRRGAAETLLPGFTFPLDLYGVSPTEVGRCAGRDKLGLGAGQRPGADGNRVSLFVPTDDGRLCEGKRVTAEVYVDKPARIQIWSVIHDGRAFLVGPDPALVPGGIVQSGGPALQIDPLALEALGDEFLVVVAEPVDSAPATAHAPCRLQQPWTSAMIPAGAAFASQTWTVLPEGTGGCGPWVPEGGASSKPEVAALLASFPVCR